TELAEDLLDLRIATARLQRAAHLGAVLLGLGLVLPLERGLRLGIALELLGLLEDVLVVVVGLLDARGHLGAVAGRVGRRLEELLVELDDAVTGRGDVDVLLRRARRGRIGRRWRRARILRG